MVLGEVLVTFGTLYSRGLVADNLAHTVSLIVCTAVFYEAAIFADRGAGRGTSTSTGGVPESTAEAGPSECV